MAQGDTFHPGLTSVDAADLLSTLGVTVSPDDIAPERRVERWLVRLPGARLAWIAASDQGATLLSRERRLLRLLRQRCPFAVPAILLESSDGAVDVRTMITAVDDPFLVYQRVLNDPDAGNSLGRNLGAALAALHEPSLAAEVAAWLPAHPEWPLRCTQIADSLRAVIADELLHERAGVVLARYADVAGSVTPAQRRLVHGDLGFHNLGVDHDTLTLRGIFDWEGACWADPHLDFRYLLTDLHDFTLFDRARAVYQEHRGTPIERERVILYNAVWAISFLAFRNGVPPDTRWCGRTLAEDLAWARRAIDLVLSESSGRVP